MGWGGLRLKEIVRQEAKDRVWVTDLRVDGQSRPVTTGVTYPVGPSEHFRSQNHSLKERLHVRKVYY